MNVVRSNRSARPIGTTRSRSNVCHLFQIQNRDNAPMCGIAGFLGYTNGAALASIANRMQLHRGPDAQGVWAGAGIALAHTRLSIIDLDARSDQPFEKGGLVIVYNGEVYNFRELRRDLERDHGVRFVTASDTEV